jgi:glucokinase
MREKNPECKRVNKQLDENFERVESKHVIKAALTSDLDQYDECAAKAVDKFAQILGVETGNFALLTLPYGGIYLIGGVTAGLHSLLTNANTNTSFL